MCLATNSKSSISLKDAITAFSEPYTKDEQ